MNTTIDRVQGEIEFLQIMLGAPSMLMQQEERDWIVARIAELERTLEQPE